MATNTSPNDLLLDSLRMEKEMFWLQHGHLDQTEVHRRWTLRASELVAVLDGAAPTQLFRSDPSRSMNTHRESSANPNPTLMARCRSDQPFPSKLNSMQNNTQQSVPMVQKRSNDSHLGPNSVMSARHVSILPIDNWRANTNDPFSSFTIASPSNSHGPSRVQRTPSNPSRLPQVPEVAVYDNPADFISTLSSDSGIFTQSTTLPSPIPRRNSRGLSHSPSQQSPSGNNAFFSQSPPTPSTTGLTHATTLTDTMSRQSSCAGSSFCGGFDMMQIQSRMSQNSELNMSDSQSPQTTKPLLAPPSKNNCDYSILGQSNILDYTGGIAHNTNMQEFTLVSAIAAPPVLSSMAAKDHEMKRSSSNESSGSSRHRASVRRQKQLVQGGRPIAPKNPEADLAMSRQSSSSDHQMIRIKSADGSFKEVVPIAKTSHNRPPKEKKFCPKCTEKPDGYRGDHELRRHCERKHSTGVRKTWVCVDASPDKSVLANCKHCRGRKSYGAYYNAAAHLRRVHFNAKPKGRKGRSSLAEKRGGKGGGEYPSMDFLKNWMEEREEMVDKVERDMDTKTECKRKEGDYDDSHDDEDNDTENYDGNMEGSEHSALTMQTSTAVLGVQNMNNVTHPIPFTPPTCPTMHRSDPMQLSHYAHASNDFEFSTLAFDETMTDTAFDESMLFTFDLPSDMYANNVS